MTPTWERLTVNGWRGLSEWEARVEDATWRDDIKHVYALPFGNRQLVLTTWDEVVSNETWWSLWLGSTHMCKMGLGVFGFVRERAIDFMRDKVAEWDMVLGKRSST